MRSLTNRPLVLILFSLACIGISSALWLTQGREEPVRPELERRTESHQLLRQQMTPGRHLESPRRRSTRSAHHRWRLAAADIPDSPGVA